MQPGCTHVGHTCACVLSTHPIPLLITLAPGSSWGNLHLPLNTIGFQGLTPPLNSGIDNLIQAGPLGEFHVPLAANSGWLGCRHVRHPSWGYRSLPGILLEKLGEKHSLSIRFVEITVDVGTWHLWEPS